MRPKTTYLIDTENVRETWAPLLDQTRKMDDFILFYTVNSAKLPISVIAKMTNNRRKVECIMTDTGANALDVTLIAELGRRIERDQLKNPNTPHAYIIVSDDHGYDPAIQHLSRQGVQVSRTATHATDARPKPESKQPPTENTSNETKEPPPKPRYSGIKEEWRQILLKHPNVTDSDVDVCVNYIPNAMNSTRIETRMTMFKTHLDRYYQNTSLSTEMYSRVKLPIRQILTHGPFSGKAKAPTN